MLLGNTNRQMATKLAKPLSTIQRRTKRLVRMGWIKPTFEIDYSKLGLKKGLLHIYLNNGDVQSIAEQTSRMPGVLSVTMYIGNSDVVAEYVSRNGAELLELTVQVKKLQHVEKVVWSEEVVAIPGRNSIMSMLEA